MYKKSHDSLAKIAGAQRMSLVDSISVDFPSVTFSLLLLRSWHSSYEIDSQAAVLFVVGDQFGDAVKQHAVVYVIFLRFPALFNSVIQVGLFPSLSFAANRQNEAV